MATAEEPPSGRVLPLVVFGSVVVALTTPLNLIMLLLCWRLIETLAGPYAADNSGAWLVLFGGAVSVGLFLILCGLSWLAFRRSSAHRRRTAVVLVLAFHLVMWLGSSLALVAQMAATGIWL
jgi:hypothetical protein